MLVLAVDPLVVYIYRVSCYPAEFVVCACCSQHIARVPRVSLVCLVGWFSKIGNNTI